jgi:hypothetical protein
MVGWMVGRLDGGTACWMVCWSEVPQRETLGMGRRDRRIVRWGWI